MAGKAVEKKSVGRSDSVWRGPRGRSQLPLEFNRRSGRGYSTRIGLEEKMGSGEWERLIDVNTNTGDIRRTWRVSREGERGREGEKKGK